MVTRKSASRKPREKKPVRETYAHIEEQTVWQLIKADKRQVTLKAVFSAEIRRPLIQTFQRDYRRLDLQAGRA